MKSVLRAALVLSLIVLAGCASPKTAPATLVTPSVSHAVAAMPHNDAFAGGWNVVFTVNALQQDQMRRSETGDQIFPVHSGAVRLHAEAQWNDVVGQSWNFCIHQKNNGQWACKTGTSPASIDLDAASDPALNEGDYFPWFSSAHPMGAGVAANGDFTFRIVVEYA